MIPRIARFALLFTGLAAPLTHAQVSMKMGDLVLFDSTADDPVAHYNRDNGVKTSLATPRSDDDGTTFQNNGEIQQGPDGSFYLADTPFAHTVKVDPRFGPSEGPAVTIYRPQASTFSIIPDNLSLSSDGGSSLRVAYSGSQGAVLKHHFDTGVLETLSSGGFLTGDIAAAGVTQTGDIVVAQGGATANLILLNGTTNAQSLMGASTMLNGPIYDVEPISANKVAITTGGNGVVLASYRLNPITAKIDTTFQNLGNFGGSAQWAKTDTDGNLLVSVYFTPSNSKILKYDLASARVDIVLATTRLTSFGVVRYPVTVEKRASLAQSSTSGSFQLSYTGQLQSSTDLANWQTVDPQPASPFTIAGTKPQEFFRVADADPHPMQGAILYRGNSYTYGQETTGPTTLPAMVTAIAKSLNYTFTSDMYAIGGISFKDHANDPASLAKVQSGHWHDAVLQNFSTNPTTYGSVADHLQYGRALYLQQIARDPQCHVYLYETPAYRADKSDFYPTIFATPDVFQSQLTTNYRLLAKNLNTEFPNNPPVTVVPTGELVQAAGGLLPLTNRFFLQMHATDGMHMSDNRLALTGLAFFVAFTHQNPAGLLSTPSVQALGLNITADKTWLEKLVWRYMTLGVSPVLVLDEPQSQTAAEGELVTFTTRVQGSGPITYQWFKDATAIPGATASSVPIVGTGGASSNIYCIATNSEGSVQTNTAVLSSAAEFTGLAANVDFGYPNGDTVIGPAPNDDPVIHWNNWAPTSTADFTGLPTTLALVRPDGSASGITLQSTVTGIGAGPNGATTVPGYPAHATIDYWYGGTPAASTPHPVIEFKAKGLKAAKTYKLVFFAARNPTGQTADNRETAYQVVGTNTSTVTLNALGNGTNTASVTGMKPDADGNLTIHITKGAANTNVNGYFYLNIMQITVE